MKVLAISNYKDPIASRPEGEIFIRLQKKGVEITIMAQESSAYAERFRAHGIRVIDFHPDKKFSWKAVRRIRQEMDAQGIDILKLYNSKAIINGLFAAMGSPVKVVLYRGYSGNIHWYDPTSYLKFLHPRADAIIANADYTRDYIRANLWTNKEKVVSISKGHDPAWYRDITPADLSEFGMAPDDFVITCVANARKMKAIPDLVEATHAFPPGANVHLLLVGKGMDHPEVLAKAEKSPLRENIHFVGFRKDALRLVKASSVFALASITGEAFTKALVEAMNLGTTPVMTDIPGNKGVVIDGKSGLVVPPSQPRQLGEALLRLWKDPELCQRLGQGAQHHIQTEFPIQKAVDKTYRLYQSLLKA